MPFCPKCGTEYQTGTKFCGKCGENVDGASAATIPGAGTTSIPAGTPAVAPAPVKQGPGFFEKLTDTKDYTEEIGLDDIKQNKVMAILAFCAVFAYIVFSWTTVGILGILAFAGLMVAPILKYKSSAFIRFVMAQLYVAFFGVLLFSLLDGTISGFFYNIISPSVEEILAAEIAGVFGGAAAAGVVVRQVLANVVAWLIHLVFMAIPIFTLVVGFINVIKEKAKGMPFIEKIKVTFEK